jgi:hypothetical protein
MISEKFSLEILGHIETTELDEMVPFPHDSMKLSSYFPFLYNKQENS